MINTTQSAAIEMSKIVVDIAEKIESLSNVLNILNRGIANVINDERENKNPEENEIFRDLLDACGISARLEVLFDNLADSSMSLAEILDTREETDEAGALDDN